MVRGTRTKLLGKVVRSSLCINMLGRSTGLKESTSFETGDTDVASGDCTEENDSKQEDSKGSGKRWLYRSKDDWENIGVVNGGPVLVKVPADNAESGISLVAKTEHGKVWVQGTVIRCAADRVIVTHSGGKTVTLYSSNPDTYSRINGFSVEYTHMGSSTN